MGGRPLPYRSQGGRARVSVSFRLPSRAVASHLPCRDKARGIYATDNAREGQHPSFQQVVIVTSLNGDIVIILTSGSLFYDPFQTFLLTRYSVYCFACLTRCGVGFTML